MTRILFYFLALASVPMSWRLACGEINTYALPAHKGAMQLDLKELHVTQTSAKPKGNELGIRAHDADHMEMLAFLFVTFEGHPQTAATCMKADIDQLRKNSQGNATFTQQTDPEQEDTQDFTTVLLTYANGSQYLYRYFGSGDQCLSIELYADKGVTLSLSDAYRVLDRQGYSPNYIPTSKDKFLYAGILFETHQYAASIPIYADFLSSAPSSSDTLTLRRVATDNMGMALGITGRVQEARKIFKDASAQDPQYPLYYYNLACADAEQGNARDAMLHLEQAFERKANTLPGENMPDPTKDDSILKLKKDKGFWAFVENLK